MSRTTRNILMILLAVMLPTVSSFAQWNVSVATMQHGSIKANATTAEAGTTVTLTVTPDKDYLLDVKSLRVELITSDDSDTPSLKAPRRAPSVGVFADVKQESPNVFSFVMPESDVLVSAAFVEVAPFIVDAETDEGGATGTTITVNPNYDDMTATVIDVTEGTASHPTAIYIPATVTDVAGNKLTVTSVASGAFLGMTYLTDIYLPDTDEPLQIANGAFLLDNETGASHRIATIHTPLPLLDDYALMTALSENYEASKVKGFAAVLHSQWTFSCGVDVVLPDGVKPYIVYSRGETLVYEQIQTNGFIKANNGVLLFGPYDTDYEYEVTAVPSNDRPSGTTPSADNANSYSGNQLIPVIEKTHFYAEHDNYVLVNKQFRPIAHEDASICCPPCKAVLHLTKANATLE